MTGLDCGRPSRRRQSTPSPIAVLPFENLSEAKANGYFATGIQDEILTRIAKIGALKVISRVSTKQYPSRPDASPLNNPDRAHARVLWGCVARQ